MQDDNRGLGQGVEDNRITKTTFRLLIEQRELNCEVRCSCLLRLYLTLYSTFAGNCLSSMPQVKTNTVPASSISANLALLSMLHPIHKLTWRENTSPSLSLKYAPIHPARHPDVDMHIVSLRTITSLPSPSDPSAGMNRSVEAAVTGGLVLHRQYFDQCYSWPASFYEPSYCQPGDGCGQVSIALFNEFECCT